MNSGCFVCGSKMKFYFRGHNFKIYRCPNCGLGATEQPRFQQSSYHRDGEYIVEEELFKNIFLKRVKEINRFLKPGRVLEIGCSTGILLSLLKLTGWEVLGVEPSRQAAAKAMARGIEVKTQKFEETRFKEKYDLVILNHTLEHLNNPKTVIKKAVGLLKPTGALYIGLPNFDSLGLRLFKPRWPLLLPDEHPWHFTQESLKKLLEEAGLKIAFVEKASGIWDVDSPVTELWQSGRSLKRRFLKNLLFSVPTLILTLLKWGSGLNIIAIKND